MILEKIKDINQVKIKLLGFTLYKRSRQTNIQDYLHGFFTIEKNNKRKIYRILGLRVASKKNKKNKNTYDLVSCVNSTDIVVPNYNVLKDELPIQIDDIIKYVELNTIKVVSFDIFDTLLLRPTLEPIDLIYLLSEIVNKKYNIEILKLRLSAENEIGIEQSNIYNIYDFVAQKLSLDETTKQLLIEEELALENKLLSVRKDIKLVYDAAVRCNKKIIAISDMYLPKDFLLKVLQDKGLSQIEKIYVSNDFHKRKDTGELYDEVIKEEKISPSSILHIGDNYFSDYVKPLEKFITAVYYPSIKNIITSEKSIYKDVLSNYQNLDIGQRLLIGFSFNRIFADSTKMPTKPHIFSDISFLTKLLIAPVVLNIALKILQNNEIQKKYRIINFASRDGYLPKKAYDFLNEKLFKTKLPSRYIYLSRRSYYLFECKDIIEYVKNINIIHDPSYKLRNLIYALISDETLQNTLLNNLSEEEKNLSFYKNKQQCIDILEKYKNILDEYEVQSKNNILKYFEQEISEDNSQNSIIFDIGYSGSIGNALKNITNVCFDKIYLYETSKNRELDKTNNTKTFNIMPEVMDYTPIHLLFEELFSPYQGACIGYKQIKDKISEPILEVLLENNQMKKIFTTIEKELNEYLNDFIDLFGYYINDINIHNMKGFMELARFSWLKSPYCEMNIVKNVIFPDPLNCSENFSLQYKIMKHSNGYYNVFSATGFNNPEKRCSINHVLSSNFNKKIGIHCHLFNVDLSEEIIKYLKDFPVEFDLILTIPNKNYENVINNLFNSKIISNLNKLIVKVVPNRGRDVAPWLIATKNEQKSYDIFCHIHTKKTQNAIWANRWRNYLFSNLIKKDSVIDIFNFFEEDKELGIIINDFYPELAKFCIEKNIPLIGQANEDVMIDDLLNRMGFLPLIPRNDLLFAAGTMFWYRPEALRPLFELDLTFEDFPEEPIGVEGTIAHAIERLPALVCERNEYKSFIYSKY